MSNVLTAVAGAEIRRGDIIKLINGQLFPALLFEQYVGAAAENIAAGKTAYGDELGFWRPCRRHATLSKSAKGAQ